MACDCILCVPGYMQLVSVWPGYNEPEYGERERREREMNSDAQRALERFKKSGLYSWYM